MHAFTALPHRAFHFGMALVANHHDVEAFLAHLRDFHMHLGHERAGGVEHAQFAGSRFRAHRLRHAVRTENQRTAFRRVCQVFNEHGAFLAQILDHIGVVHDLVTHVDRRTEQRDGPLHDLDCTIDTGTEAAWLSEENFDIEKGVSGAHGYRIPMIFTSNASAWPASGWLKSNSAEVSPTSLSTPA